MIRKFVDRCMSQLGRGASAESENIVETGDQSASDASKIAVT